MPENRYSQPTFDEKGWLYQPEDRATKLVADAMRYSISSAGVFQDQERWHKGERAFRSDKINKFPAAADSHIR